MTVTPSSMGFGSVDVGATSSNHAYILSSGTGPLVTSISITGDFAISSATDCPNAPNPLAAVSSCLVFVTFSPTAAGGRKSNLPLFRQHGRRSPSPPPDGNRVPPEVHVRAHPRPLF